MLDLKKNQKNDKTKKIGHFGPSRASPGTTFQKGKGFSNSERTGVTGPKIHEFQV